MKKIKNILALVLIASSLLTGCNWLELQPPNGLVLDEYWQTKEDVEATLLGAYQQFAKIDEMLFLYGEIRADLIQPDQALNYQQLIINNNIFSNNTLCDWSDFYKIINYCNNVIEIAPDVLNRDQTFTEFQMLSYQSEAIYLRSLAYFYLVRIFKDVPYITKPTVDDNVDFFVPKTSGDSILMFIKADLQKFETTIPTDYSTLQKSKGRATKGAFNALLADISLWEFDYNACLEYIEKIDALNLYYLLPSGSWFDNFKPGNSLESIFEFQFDGNGQNNSMYDYTYNLSYYRSSDYAIELLNPEVSMERVRGFGSLSLESTNYLIWKYAGGAPDRRSLRSSAESRACNFIIYRFADIILMKAEALAFLNRFNEAEIEINKIRARALMEPLEIINSQAAFEDAILTERAKELAFEGKRWFDLLRMGRRNNFERKKDLIEIIIKNAPSTQKLVLASKLSNPLGWYLPIYKDELEKNLNLKQNPYYEDK